MGEKEMPYTGLTSGNAPTLSQRQKGELKRINGEEEQLAPPDKLRSSRGQVFENPHVVGNVRQRVEAEQAAAREKAKAEEQYKFDSFGQPRHVGVPVFRSNEERIAYFDAEHKREVEQQARWTAEREQEQAEINRRNDERQKRNSQIIEINLSLDQFNPTPAEMQKVFEIAKTKYSEQLPTGVQALTILFAIRDNTTNVAPDWATWIVGGGRRG
jgi:hypothetical protein